MNIFNELCPKPAEASKSKQLWIADSQNNLAIVYKRLGRFDEALALFSSHNYIGCNYVTI